MPIRMIPAHPPPRCCDIDTVTVIEKVDSGSKAHSNVVAAGCTVDERITTDAGIGPAGCVCPDRMPAIGCVVVPSCVEKKGIIPCRRVKDADGVAPERVRTVGGVFKTGSVGKERPKAYRRVLDTGG